MVAAVVEVAAAEVAAVEMETLVAALVEATLVEAVSAAMVEAAKREVSVGAVARAAELLAVGRAGTTEEEEQRADTQGAVTLEGRLAADTRAGKEALRGAALLVEAGRATAATQEAASATVMGVARGEEGSAAVEQAVAVREGAAAAMEVAKVEVETASSGWQRSQTSGTACRGLRLLG